MLLPRIRVKRRASDRIADSVGRKTFPPDLSNLARESKSRAGVRITVHARNRKSPGPRCDGFAGVDRHAHDFSIGCRWSSSVAADGESPAPRSARDDLVASPCSRIAEPNRHHVRTRETVAAACDRRLELLLAV